VSAVTARSTLAAVGGDRVRALQHALYWAAKADPTRRFHALFDKVCRSDVLDRAWQDVRRNHGAAGIDRVTLTDAEEYGVARLLGEPAAELEERRYRPLPARRVFIPKPGSTEQRPLSIPAVRDRIVQAAVRIVLEPIFEADSAVAVGQLDGQPVAVSGGGDRTLRVWDLRTGSLVGEPLTGSRVAWINAVAVGDLDGRQVVVSGGDDRRVWIWDLSTGSLVAEPLTGHMHSITSVALGELDGRPVAVTGSYDETVRIWDLRTGSPVGEPLTGHGGHVTAVVMGELDSRPVVVSGGFDGTVRIWDLRASTTVAQPLTSLAGGISAVAVGELDGRPVAVSGGGDRTLRVWDLGSGAPIGEFHASHDGYIHAVAVGQLDGRPVAVSGGETVRIWDLSSGTLIGEPLTGHMNWINAVAVGDLDGHPVVASGGNDMTVRIWDLDARRANIVETGAAITAIAPVPWSKILVATARGLTLLQLIGDNKESYGGDR
jgi:WD40 repeat protein